jgi:hypothetical protein
VTVITPEPLFFKDAVIQIGADDYGAAISNGMLTPNPTVARFTGLKPNADYKDADIDWKLDLTFVQDWESATSLSRKLWASQGTTITDCIIKPKTLGGASFTVDLHILPGSVGGVARAHATSTVSLEVVGQPEFDYTAPE